MSQHPKICPECSTPYHAAATFCQLDGSALVEQQVSADPLVGARLLEQFDVHEAIGSGGMGTVYRAHQAALQRDVAIKILHRDLAKNADAVRRFQREARVASSLDHPNLVDVYLFGELPDGSLYLVMEYLEGRTLAQALFEDGHFPLARGLRIAHATAMGVGAAHRQGIVHRDVKPENIMLVKRDGDPDFVKVLDFGIARLLWDEQSHITQSGVIFGTARYISPEGASGEATDARSDVYSLAVLTYQLLSGSVPFDDPSPVALLMKHLRQKPPPLETRPGGAHVPAAIAEVVMRGLNKHPDARHDNAAAFARALESAAAASGVAITAETSRAAQKGSAATLLQTGPLIDAPAPVAAPMMAARPQMATRRDGSVMPAIAQQELARMAASVASGPPAGNGHGAGMGHARQMMPVVELPVLHPADVGPRVSHDPGPPGGRSYDESFVGIPGLSSARPRALMPILVGFLVGAMAVGLLAFGLFQRGESEAAEHQRSLEERAREALSHGAIDTPPGDNVLELTRRLLEIDPAHAGARSIRREAALLLRERAANARVQNDMPAAREAYEQVLRLFPEDAAATEGLRLLAQVEQVASAPPLSAGIHLDPDDPGQRERVRLVGVFGPGMRLPSDVVPEFTVLRAGRRLDRLPATPGDVSGTWVADYAFAQTGDHEVTLEFGVGAQRVMLRQDVSVGRADRAPRTTTVRPAVPTEPTVPPAGTSRPLGPPTTLPPPPVEPVPTTMNDGIDWGVPSEPSEEPPPWTG
ncbi:MAG: serine/threonine protein kinase [Sandaracinaceae bacterium]|jgi:hypothetical protein|nr:serine/threonine protein kinase [Sandaracinaceae bacterium]MBP7683706.1 serine/threonine protein kinase [Deltaproteobacteria bacterium]MBK7156931.1 serine/threonine protein kinase [Sandaracinaceae bacterium]MBK7776047.1 serine/threonine protein kinase [Sandaracinaceae bacterium]MBK8407878.1 serine/threonine protein kinase [Sandaracinaceae bacterium]